MKLNLKEFHLNLKSSRDIGSLLSCKKMQIIKNVTLIKKI